MTLATVPQANPNDELTDDLINRGPNAVAAVVNGNLDDSNINFLSGTKIAAGTLPGTALLTSQDDLIPADGWVPANETWTYVSATTFTVPGDRLTKYTLGVKLKYTQSSTVKYAEVQSSSYSAPNTTVTVATSSTPIANAAISSPFLSRISTPEGVTQGSGLPIIGRQRLTSPSDTISLTGLPPRKYLRIYISVLDTGGTIEPHLRFNNDAGNNYARRFSTNGAADTTAAAGTTAIVTGSAAYPQFVVMDIMNVQDKEKLATFEAVAQNAAGASNIPGRTVGIAKWANTTDQITRIDVINPGTGDFAIGSEIVVYGNN